MGNFLHIKISYLITKSVDAGLNFAPKITLGDTLGAHGINTLELNNFEHKLGATLNGIEINNHVAAFSSELHWGSPSITSVLYCLSPAVREELDHFGSWHTLHIHQVHLK